MSKVMTFSRFFPAYHPKAGKPTHFVEKITKGLLNLGLIEPFEEIEKFYGTFYEYQGCNPKYHTIRSGNRWKVGDKFSPRVWSGTPRRSKQITIAPDIEVKKVWNIEVDEDLCIWVYSQNEDDSTILERLALNDGLELQDLFYWFNKPMIGQIICWNDSIEY